MFRAVHVKDKVLPVTLACWVSLISKWRGLTKDILNVSDYNGLDKLLEQQSIDYGMKLV